MPRTTQGTEQQLFADGEPFTLNAVVQATGKDGAATLICQVGDARQEAQVAIKAGERQTIPFRIGEGKLLKPGDNAIEVHLDARPEAMPHSHHRFVTVRVRPRQKVLVLLDDPKQVGLFAQALTSLGYAPEVRPIKGLTKDALAGAAAVYLLGVAAPEDNWWKLLAEYVKSGGGLGIVPAGADLRRDSYASAAAHALMPGKIDVKIDKTPVGGSEWNWATAKYDHSFLKRFKAWKDDDRTDFMVVRSGASYYWGVTGVTPRDALVLVAYNDAARNPAVIERLFDAKSGVQGKTLLFTTPLDEQDPRWNNYTVNLNSFYVALLSEATRYLAGESVAPQLNFTLGRGDPVVVVPPGPALELLMTLRGPGMSHPLTLAPGQTQLVLRDLKAPGNYVLDARTKDGRELRGIASVSLNVPAEECDLTKVPAGEFEPLFGGDALLTLGQQGSLNAALQSHRNEPLDLMPYLMLALLFALALENLLANKFYRQADA